MKVSLIALYTCCAVSSAAFAYQNAPQSGLSVHSGVLGTQGTQFAMRDDPGIDPPRAAIKDDPGIDPPRVAVTQGRFLDLPLRH